MIYLDVSPHPMNRYLFIYLFIYSRRWFDPQQCGYSRARVMCYGNGCQRHMHRRHTHNHTHIHSITSVSSGGSRYKRSGACCCNRYWRSSLLNSRRFTSRMVGGRLLKEVAALYKNRRLPDSDLIRGSMLSEILKCPIADRLQRSPPPTVAP